MVLTWVLSAPDGPHVGPTNLAIRELNFSVLQWWLEVSDTEQFCTQRQSFGSVHWQLLLVYFCIKVGHGPRSIVNTVCVIKPLNVRQLDLIWCIFNLYIWHNTCNVSCNFLRCRIRFCVFQNIALQNTLPFALLEHVLFPRFNQPVTVRCGYNFKGVIFKRILLGAMASAGLKSTELEWWPCRTPLGHYQVIFVEKPDTTTVAGEPRW